MNFKLIACLLVASLGQLSTLALANDNPEWSFDEKEYTEDVGAQPHLSSAPWSWISSSYPDVLINPPNDPSSRSKLNETLREEKKKLSDKINRKEYKKALKQVNSLMKRMLPVTETTKNKIYIDFVGHLYNDKIICLKGLNNFIEALIEVKELINYSQKISDHAVESSKNKLNQTRKEYKDKVNRLLSEFSLQAKIAKTNKSVLKKAFKKMCEMVPQEVPSLLDEESRGLVATLRKQIDHRKP